LKEIFSYFYENIFIFFLIIFLIIGNETTITQYFSPSVIVLVIVALVRIGPALNRTMISINNIFHGMIKFKKISKYLNIEKYNNVVKLNLDHNNLNLKITGKGFDFLKHISINHSFIFKKGINKIVGKNGSGKSTILNILMDINYGFKVITNVPSKNIGYLNQIPINY
jgi:ABC-type multidrug transport system fused ATPase/permease subunit